MIQLRLTAAQRAVVDEYAITRRQALGWKPAPNPYLLRFQELEAEILSWTEKQPANEDLEAVGRVSTVPISSRRNHRTVINVAALFAKLGMEWIVAHCVPNLGDVDKAPLSAEEKKTFIHEERSGKRTIGEPVSAPPKVAVMSSAKPAKKAA